MGADGEIGDRLAVKFGMLLRHLDERARRLYLGSEALALEPELGRERALALVAGAAGVSRTTVRAGADELGSGAGPLGRVRRPGAGRPRAEDRDPGLAAALEALIGDDCRGDPQSPLRWTARSAAGLARALTAGGHRCSKPTVLRLLHAGGYSTQGNAKTVEGSAHPDRDAQFRYIARQAGHHLAAGDPVISVDTKKKEKVGLFAQAGREWRPGGDPVRVRDHDFAGPDVPVATPYGVYDVGANDGYVNVGTDHDTAAFAVESIRRWWRAVGSGRYPAARRLLITADAGGSNGYRPRAWKAGLADLAAETGLKITVCHFPPGTSKWNKIEHRLFCHISRNWRARPLTSYDIIVSTIAATTTATGLAVTAALDAGVYPTGITITDARMRDLEDRFLARHGFHGAWNYTISPAPRPAPAPQAPPPGPRPAPPRAAPAPASRCSQATLNHPALTGTDPASVTALAARMDIALAARREHDLHARRGHRDRLHAHPRPDPRTRLDPTDKILATLIHLHLRAPASTLAPLFGTSGTTIRAAVRAARELLTQAGITITPAPQPIPTTTALRAHAATAGITLTPPPATSTNPAARDTPTEK
jgi:hypothetical protein